MSMQVVLVKVGPQLYRKIVESEGEVLDAMGDEEPVSGFLYATDTYDELDYRDISQWATDENHPFFDIFAGDVLLDDYEWTSGPPMYHSHEEVQTISRRLNDCDQADWQVARVADFFRRAVLEGKGVIVGVD